MTKYIFLFALFWAFLYNNAEVLPPAQIAKSKLNVDGEVPILAWYSILASETLVERYREMRDVSIIYSLSFLPILNEFKKALDAAEQAGVKLLVSCSGLESEPDKTVKQLMEHPAVAGYHLRDEPAVQFYPELSAWAKKYNRLTTNIFVM